MIYQPTDICIVQRNQYRSTYEGSWSSTENVQAFWIKEDAQELAAKLNELMAERDAFPEFGRETLQAIKMLDEGFDTDWDSTTYSILEMVVS